MKKNISKFQLFSIIFFLISPSIVMVGIQKSLLQDGWIGVLLAGVLQSLVLIIYTLLVNRYPNSGLDSMLKKSFGKIIGKVFILIYSSYFIYLAYRVSVDLYHLINITLLDKTPRWAIFLSLLLVIVYAVSSGIEAIGRTAVFLFVTLLSIGLLIEVSSSFSSVNHVIFQNITPVLENGWASIIEWSLKNFNVLFGEMIILLVLFSTIKDTRKSMKFSYVILLLVTLNAVVVSINTILRVNPLLIERSVYPLMLIAQKKSISFIDKIDSFYFFQVIFMELMKITLLFYASSALIKQSFKKVTPLLVNIFLAIMIFMLAMFNKQNIYEFLEIGTRKIPIYLHIPLQIGIPLIMVLITLMKKTKVSSNK